MPRRTRLTARGRAVLAVAALLTLATVVVTGVVVWKKFFGHDCLVTVDGREAALGRDEAMRATAAAALAVRRDQSVRDVVEASTGLGGTEAADVTAAVSGKARAALTCTGGGADGDESDSLSSRGLTKRAETVRGQLDEAFGRQALGGFEPGGVSTGHMPGSAHYEGRAIDVFFRPITAANKTRGWALAQYLVAHAERLEVETVIFDGRIWTARRGFQGWRDYEVSTSGRSAATVKILEHRDHVHVDVAD